MVIMNMEESDLDKAKQGIERKLVPIGTYKAEIIECDYQENSKHTGHYHKLVYQITEGENEGRIVVGFYNTDNPSDYAQSLATTELNEVCMCILGVPIYMAKDTENLKDLPLCIKVGIRPANGPHSAQNTIEGYISRRKDRTAQQPAAAQQPETTQEHQPWAPQPFLR